MSLLTPDKSIIIAARRLATQQQVSVTPCGPDKKATIKWAEFQRRRMTLDEVNKHFIKATHIAAIGGAISGNLECLDFDDPATFAPFMAALKEHTPGLPGRLSIRRTPSGGYHAVYRCQDPVGGNQKLACDPAGQVRIETRGEGGYFLTPPSPGYSDMTPGVPIPTLTPEEVATIHQAARSFDQRQAKAEQTPAPRPHQHTPHAGQQESPGDRFNADNSVADVLTRYGWKPAKMESGGPGWTRPGKDTGTSGVLLDKTGNFYVWSSNASPLEAGRSYDAFGLYAAYEHGGDLSRAARSLKATVPTPDCERGEEQREPPLSTADPEPAIPPTAEGDPPLEDVNEIVARLAALSPLAYDLARKQEATALGVRPTALDQAVKDARKGLGDVNDLPFDDVDPWPHPVDPAQLLTDIAQTIRRFIVCDKEVSIAVALWSAMTWFIDVVQVAPLAVITAPEKRCGKTQLLSLLGRVVAKAIQASSISPAALFRTIDAWGPTLLIDEADAFMKDNEELRGLINSGHTRDSAYVIRTVGDAHTPFKFNTWGCKALSGIGHVADTLMDRAIVMELRRKMPHEQVDRIRYAEPGLFDDLRSKLARFAEDYSEKVRQARPPLPPSLNDRAQDNWEPLLAIAMVAGGDWMEVGTKAALKLSGGESAAQTIGTELLADIKETFEVKAVDRISTADLINALCADDEKTWATYNRGKEIKPRQLANRLRGFGVSSKDIRRPGHQTAVKGFELRQFDDAFSRYLDSSPLPSATTRQTNNDGALGVADETRRRGTVADNKICNTTESLGCRVVADRTPPAASDKKVEVFI
jgi:putative DNA primase/helicase